MARSFIHVPSLRSRREGGRRPHRYRIRAACRGIAIPATVEGERSQPADHQHAAERRQCAARRAAATSRLPENSKHAQQQCERARATASCAAACGASAASAMPWPNAKRAAVCSSRLPARWRHARHTPTGHRAAASMRTGEPASVRGVLLASRASMRSWNRSCVALVLKAERRVMGRGVSGTRMLRRRLTSASSRPRTGRPR